MPLYTYRDGCGEFDQLALVSWDIATCPYCGGNAERLPFYSVNLAGSAAIPDGEHEYQIEHDKRGWKKQGWDYDRSLEHIRSNLVERETGKWFDAQKASQPVEKRVY